MGNNFFFVRVKLEVFMAVKIYFVFCVKDLWGLTGGYHVLKQYTAHISIVEVSGFGKVLGTNRFFSPTAV